MAQKEPENMIPSTHAKATNRSAKEDSFELIHFKAQLAFFSMHGIVSIALYNFFRSSTSET